MHTSLSSCIIFQPIILNQPVCGNDSRISLTHFPSLSASYQMSLRFHLTLYLPSDFFQLSHCTALASPPPGYSRAYSPLTWKRPDSHFWLRCADPWTSEDGGGDKTWTDLKLDSTFLPHSLFWACVSTELWREEKYKILFDKVSSNR